MTTATHDVGDLRHLAVLFTDINGTAADPTTITFRLVRPDGTVVSYAFVDVPATIFKTGTGAYYVEYAIAVPGRHVYRWTGAGTIETAEQGEFYARRTEAA
jgi:hypothetical protein